MIIKEIQLQNFRNLAPLNLNPQSGLNVFFGKNAQGKTNLLESLYFCTMGRSMRTKNDYHMINFEKEDTHIRLLISKNNISEKIDAYLKKDIRKAFAINGLPIKKLSELYGQILIVVFSPDDLSLIKQGPGERRKLIDMQLVLINKIYYHDLGQYYKLLKHRNTLLKSIQKNPALEETLFVWDEQLISYAKKIIVSRESFISKLNIFAKKRLKTLTGGIDELEIIYKPNCEIKLLEKKIAQSVKRDIFLGITSFGPHKDDISFIINNQDAKAFASQGQQRTTALALKLAEIDFIREETGENPILLLDDVFSELDENRQKYLLESINELQIFLTCTGIEDSIRKYINSKNLFYVDKGIITQNP